MPRPSAFEVSFPGEDFSPPEPPYSTVSNIVPKQEGKRKNDAPISPPGSHKRSRNSGCLQAIYYTEKPNEIVESATLLVAGEDMDAVGYDSNDKPVRILSRFSFFDFKPGMKKMEMISLSAMDDHNDSDWNFEGAGLVSPIQVDDDDDTQLEDKQQIRLRSLLRYTIDYSKENDPIYIETPHAFYILSSPSRLYRPLFFSFYKSHRIAQIVVTSASSDPCLDWDTFLKQFLVTEDRLVGQGFMQADLNDAIPIIQRAIGEQHNIEKLRAVPFLRHFLRDVGPQISRPIKRPVGRAPPTLLKGSLDLAVLRPENQMQTHVTPLIDSLASGLFHESLAVIGSRPVPPNEDVKKRVKSERQKALEKLRSLVEKTLKPYKVIITKNDQRSKPRSVWLPSVEIDGELYEVGDAVIMPMGRDEKRKAAAVLFPHQIPKTATIQTYFWFAKIIHINGDDETAHVQWFWHSSTTVLQEISDPQELFLADLCDTIDLRCVAGKAIVHYKDPNSDTSSSINQGEFFYKFAYDSALSTFMDVDHQRMEAAKNDAPPHNCPVCLLVEQKDRHTFWDKLQDGIMYHGLKYHVHDFALIRAGDSPCLIGYITDIRFPAKSQRHLSPTLVMKMLGRVTDLAGILPQQIVKDERHLFMTDSEVKVEVEELIRVCYVFPYAIIDDLDFWTALSPDHFYVRYRCPSLNVSSWNDMQPISQDMHVCVECCREKIEQIRWMKEFLSLGHLKPLRALDLFGGVGAFGLGMKESGCIKVTHAVEISPSAAKTFTKNSPDTVMYNACINAVLQYAVKKQKLKGQDIKVPMTVYDKTALPPPPLPGDIEVLLAGFPCQSHSHLNMYRKADDPQSSLILPALSWVDFLRPKFCMFENVPGFLRYNLKATQAGPHKVEGGIPMGGLKFLLHALVTMNYQVRYGLLQAAHYGTPQSRVRFFLIAAQSGNPLPELPQPTHDSPLTDTLGIKLPVGETIRPIRTTRGTAPHPFVSIDDAISDLPRFDWKNPRQSRESPAKQQEARTREKTIPALNCRAPPPYCGYKGAVDYHHDPKTTYQVRSRQVMTRDLQHYTRCLIESKVERVVTIPLDPKADYRCLSLDLCDWQLANPSSAVAKTGFRPGFYGRLDKDGWFQTTTTNIDPTAKQSRVLNPYCKRIITVRELARSQGFPDNFVFESINNNVTTMHRQIGNAVPWLISVALGKEIRTALFNKWLAEQDRMEEG